MTVRTEARERATRNRGGPACAGDWHGRRIGMDRQGRLLFVVHIAFEEQAIRILSARKATREERRHYED